jgi:pilus assembly protein CpaB
MRILAFLVLFFGGALTALTVSYGFHWQRFSQPQASAVLEKSETVTLMAAKQTLPWGTKLKPEHVQLVEWPRSQAPRGAISSPEPVFGVDGKDARYVLLPIEAGEPILLSKLSAPNQTNLTMRVRRGSELKDVPVGE